MWSEVMAHYQGTTGNDHIHGLAESDVFDGFGMGQDILFGGAKDDVFNFVVDDQVDFIDGAYGDDTINYSGSDRAVAINLSSNSVFADLSGSMTSVDPSVASVVAIAKNIENATGTQYDDLIFGTDTDSTGMNGANVLNGGAGNDHLYGLGGNDTLIGGRGNDYIDGGIGIDTVSYADVDRGVGVALNLSDEWVNGMTPQRAQFEIAASGYVLETDTLVNVENAVGTSHFDIIVGGIGDNTLDGGAGNDLLEGHIGKDTLIGGLGDDHLTGGAGADHLVGGPGSDWAEYFDEQFDLNEGAPAQPGQVVISLLHPENNTGFAAGDTYDSIENVLGSGHDDNITGNDNNNILVDTIGSNVIHGGGGDDILAGSPNNPDWFDGGYNFSSAPVIINGNPDHDTVDYSLGVSGSASPFNPAVTVDLQNQSLNAGGALGDRFFSIENVTGTFKFDNISGDGGNNVLRGLDGNDTLMGRGGNDVLIGGDGDDTAIFSGNVVDYTFKLMHLDDGEGYLQVQDTHGGRDGTDNVIEVEHLQFHDATLDTATVMHLMALGELHL
jgi:Ca2+-binding RTX toxin-like protein